MAQCAAAYILLRKASRRISLIRFNSTNDVRKGALRQIEHTQDMHDNPPKHSPQGVYEQKVRQSGRLHESRSTVGKTIPHGFTHTVASASMKKSSERCNHCPYPFWFKPAAANASRFVCCSRLLCWMKQAMQLRMPQRKLKNCRNRKSCCEPTPFDQCRVKEAPVGGNGSIRASVSASGSSAHSI